MAQLNQQFTAADHEDMRDFSVIPAGDYLAHISKSEIKPTKNGNGSYLELSFDIDSPEFVNRKVWTRLNLVNPNSVAVEIAQSELKSICDAVGLASISDSDELHGKQMCITLKVEPATANYAESNSIVKYKKASELDRTPTPTNTAKTETPETPATDKPAWAEGS